MPRKVTAYACEFRCGRRVTTSRKGMELHEERCWSNPVRRTCKTCRHESIERGCLPEEGWDGRACTIDVLSEGDAPLGYSWDRRHPLVDTQIDLDPIEAPYDLGPPEFRIRVNCWLWAPK